MSTAVAEPGITNDDTMPERDEAVAMDTVTGEPSPTITEQANKALGKVTLYDECVTRVLQVQAEIDQIEEEIEGYQSDIKDCRSALKANYAKLKGLNADLRDIKNGQYQRSLFSGIDDTDETPIDPATETPIINLGVTEKEAELLEEADIKTVAELEKQMRTNAWWHREIKGFGQAKVDKLSDLLMGWRMKNPVPATEEDDDEPEDDVVDDGPGDAFQQTAEESA
jgi:hypothetical protein